MVYYYYYFQRFLNVWCRFVLGVLWNAEVCFHPSSSLIGKVLALVMPFTLLTEKECEECEGV